MKKSEWSFAQEFSQVKWGERENAEKFIKGIIEDAVRGRTHSELSKVFLKNNIKQEDQQTAFVAFLKNEMQEIAATLRDNQDAVNLISRASNAESSSSAKLEAAEQLYDIICSLYRKSHPNPDRIDR